MKMSERNKLLVEFQGHMQANVESLIDMMEHDHKFRFTREEIKGALQHVSNTYTK